MTLATSDVHASESPMRFLITSVMTAPAPKTAKPTKMIDVRPKYPRSGNANAGQAIDKAAERLNVGLGG